MPMIFFFCASCSSIQASTLSSRADFLEHVDDAFIGAAVQRAFERADGGGDGGINVAQGRDRDARAEGAGVDAVIGVQHIGDVERLGRFLRRRLAVDAGKENARPRSRSSRIGGSDLPLRAR